jgi:acylpyruvate hydrolase
MKIICIGFNYLNHAQELNSQVPSQPIFFLKPDTALLRNNNAFFIPDFSEELHYEVELVIKINKLGKSIQQKFANRYYSEIGVGIDFTARDIQRECMAKGLPWEISKGFDNSAAISHFIPLTDLPDLENIQFRLDLNGKTVQIGATSKMIFDFDAIITHVSKYMTLKTGDLIYTGTPEGVGSVKIGDRLQAYIEDQLLLDFVVK